jgi:hypothetical protein
MQLLQTDSPWIQADDHGPGTPLRALVKGFGDELMKEPGSRLSLGKGADGERIFAYTTVDPTSTTSWETTASSGVDATHVGCLRAASALGSDEGSLTVCRAKIPAVRDADAGAPNPDAERAIVRVTICQSGACTTAEYPSQDPAAQGPGDMLRLEVDNQQSGSSCVRVRSAAAADADLTPRWQDLGSPACFAAPLVHQGLASASSAWFFGTRRTIAGTSSDVSAQDFTGVVAEGAGDGGAHHDAASLLTDDSYREP